MRQIGPDLLSKLNSNEQTAANKSEPKMSVQVSRARTTVMDSTYWTVETIRTKAGLGDISLAARRLKAHGRPDRLYEIHVDGGQVKTTIREYPDLQKDGWQPQFELGAGSAVAIAFDGEWELWRGKWRFESHEKPWIMWVDGTGKLWAQHWDDETTKQELATGVVSVRAIRAWKTLEAENKDQGIVVGYIKSDGKVYYRQFIQLLDLTYTWDIEYTLSDFTGTAESLNLFITHDFRMGFTVSDSTGNAYWYITKRNYSAMTTGRDAVRLNRIEYKDASFVVGELTTIEETTPDETVQFLEIHDFGVFNIYEATATPQVVTVSALSGRVLGTNTFSITFSHNVYVFDTQLLTLAFENLTILSAVISGKTITFSTLEVLNSDGFQINLGGGLISGIVSSNRNEIYNGGVVNIQGDLPPITETVKVDIAISSGTFDVSEIILEKFYLENPDTVKLTSISYGTANFTITEVSTQPI